MRHISPEQSPFGNSAMVRMYRYKNHRRNMCNFHSITTEQPAIVALFRVVSRYVGNLAPRPGVLLDYSAPVIRKLNTAPRV